MSFVAAIILTFFDILQSKLKNIVSCLKIPETPQDAYSLKFTDIFQLAMDQR